ncbi:MAG: pyridoxal phosphate-dependent aminotransferase [Rhodovibrionaceae bacterium]|nr:pyridoxal phosphate-dependent aminotransferase [Rhodovibrionaceae bacterium]
MPDTAHRANAYPLPIREEVHELEASRIVEVWEMGFAMDDVIGLWVGEGDLPTPDFISGAAVRALQEGHTFYSHKRGIPKLREALKAYTDGLYGLDLDYQRFSVTASGMNGLLVILQAVLSRGDEVICVTPVWPNIMKAAQIAGGRVVEVGLDPREDGSYRLDLDKLRAAVTDKTRLIFIASPSNPTGWMMEREEQQAVLELCREKGVWLISDEVYNRFVYDRPVAPSLLELADPDDPVFVLNSFSKSWAMTGWRLGWVTHPLAFAEVFDKLIEFNTSGTQAFLHHGCIAALEEGEPFVREMVERCRRGGELVYQRLAGLPRVTVARPRASFYCFFRVEGMDDSLAFAKRVLRETGVGLAPGSAFGDAGEGRLRLCFAASQERLSQAMDRLEPALS